MTKYAEAIYILKGHILEYEMDYFIPNCGSVNLPLNEIITLMKNTTICEVIAGAIWKMDWQWEIGYIGCQVEFQDLFTECTGKLEHTTSSNSRTSQNAIEILKNQDGEIRIPCSDEDNQTTLIPNNPQEITLLQTTVSDSTITENKGSTWSDLVSLCTILPLLLLLFQ
ncbi:unnamed protein product [Fasciola hepatica]|uniref:Uncharacterized protein n=1 Tax=Fasciola hepatica TaxID=6192 RepID=A0ABC9HH16_FASHE